MPFDPTKPFERINVSSTSKPTTKAGFDPSRPFEAVDGTDAAAPATPAPGKLESVLRGAAQGATFNFSDEIVAGMEALFTEKTYEQAVKESRDANAAAEEANPWSYGLGGVGGGLATAAIPGLGLGNFASKGVGLGAKVASAAKGGALAGVLSGAGASTAEGPVGIAEDALKGGLIGGAGGAVLQAAGTGMHKAGSAIAHKILDAVNPETQLAMAVGAGSKQLNPAARFIYQKTEKAVKKLHDLGLFADDPNQVLDENLLFERLGSIKKVTGEKIGALVKTLQGSNADDEAFSALSDDLQNVLLKEAENATPGKGLDSFLGTMGDAVDELLRTKGNLGALWQLKSRSGFWAKNAWANPAIPADAKQGYKLMNEALDNFLEQETARMASTSTNPALASSLGSLNEIYAAAKTVEPLLGAQIGKNATKRSYLGFGGQDLPAGGAVAAIASGLGVPPPIASALGFGGAVANQWARSVPGRIARANLGMQLEQRAQKASEMAGAIPRTIKGFKDWAQKHIAMIPPEMQQGVSAILGAPDDRAEQMIRAAMPAFAQYFSKAKYPSEFEGKVSADDDKEAIRRELEKLGMPSTDMAVRLSALYEDGTIAPEVFDPKAYEDQMMDIAMKFGAM